MKYKTLCCILQDDSAPFQDGKAAMMKSHHTLLFDNYLGMLEMIHAEAAVPVAK